jgi:hypothetical protein
LDHSRYGRLKAVYHGRRQKEKMDHGTDPEIRRGGKNGHPDRDAAFRGAADSLGLHAVLNTEDGMSHNKRRTEEI